MSHNISIIHVSSQLHVEKINQLASILGMGEKSLSIELTDGVNTFWACHSYWAMDKYIAFRLQLPLMMDVTPFQAALLDLKEFSLDTSIMTATQKSGLPIRQFNEMLNILGLHRVE